jgi:RNA polymerase sigma-70 factor (ECF subfamily)
VRAACGIAPDADREAASGVRVRRHNIPGFARDSPFRQKTPQDFLPGGNYPGDMSRDAAMDDLADGECAPAELLAQHARWLRTVLLARSGEPAAVDELFQDVAVAVLKKPPLEVNAARRPAWLYGVAVRIAILYRRRLGRRRRFLERLESAATRNDRHDDDPLGWLLADERQRLVRQALARLAPKDRELLLLKYTEDWSYVDIADHLGLSASAVEARLHRARGRLRSELAAREVLEVSHE